MSYLFLFVSKFKLSNNADLNTLYASGYNLKETKKVLVNDLNEGIEWFYKNYMVVNTGKCHYGPWQ